ncbi:MAG: host attachment protein [Opitutus sp.]|nr:host attachment protein [Opitutus sp.]
MSEHYIVTADKGHVRIFRRRQEPGQSQPAFEEVRAMDFPAGVRSYTAHDSDMAGRFQGSKHQTTAPGSPAARTGMSIDERLPMKNEEDRRSVERVASVIESFMGVQQDATWDFAAAQAVHNLVLEKLSAPVKQRLQQSVAKDLVNQPPQELASHFAART